MLLEPNGPTTQPPTLLQACSGSMERAGDWLFSHMDDLDAAVAGVIAAAQGSAAAAAAVAAPAAAGAGSGSGGWVRSVQYSTAHFLLKGWKALVGDGGGEVRVLLLLWVGAHLCQALLACIHA